MSKSTKYHLSQSDIALVVARVLAEVASVTPPQAEKAAPQVTVAERMPAKDEPKAIVAERKLLPEVGAITFGNLTVEAPEFDPAKLDVQAAAKERSPYNKLRFRVEGSEPLSNEVTFRDLLAEHVRLAALVAAKGQPKAAKQKKAAAPAAKAATRVRDGKGRFVKQTAAVIEPDAKAARIKAVAEALSISVEAATTIVELSDV